MEILDAGSGRRTRGAVGRQAEPTTELMLERVLDAPAPQAAAPGEQQTTDDDATDLSAAAPEGVADRPATWAVLRGVLGPDALALTAFTMAVLQLFSGGLSSQVLNVVYVYNSTAGPQEQADMQAKAGLGGAALLIAIAVVAVLRLRRARTAWAAPVAGAALLLGVTLVAISAWLLWKVPTLPASY